MKKLLLLLVICGAVTGVHAQASKTELYDLVKKLLYDSTGYENVGDWAVGAPKTYPVRWQEDRIEMSDDTSINFFRKGTANITIGGKPAAGSGPEGKWSILLKGARSGYSSFSIVSPATTELPPKITIDNLFGNKPFKARLLKSCEGKPASGYYYYEVKIPKKDVAFIKISWATVNGSTTIRIDGYDSWSKHAVKLDCP